MDVYRAVRTRQSIRKFTDRPVPPEALRRVLAAAADAPSGSNLQPWHVHVVSGEPLAELKKRVAQRVAAGDSGDDREFSIYPPELRAPYLERMAALGDGRYGSLGIARDDAAALRAFKLAARKGNAFAMDNLGWMADTGRGMPADPAEALKWYRLGEAKGNAPARNHVALMASRGRGMPRDDAAALNGFRAASEQGLAAARHNLGYMVASGRGGIAADPPAGLALQELARGASPPEPDALPAVDAASFTPSQQARAQQLLAEFRRSPNLLAALDQSASGTRAVTGVAATPGRPATAVAGADRGEAAPPSATQR